MEGNSKIDNVNHPKHYQSRSGLEVIDVIESFTENLKGAEATNTGNILKYMCRWKEKNGLEDLKKAEWYLKRLIAYVENHAVVDSQSKVTEHLLGFDFDGDTVIMSPRNSPSSIAHCASSSASDAIGMPAYK